MSIDELIEKKEKRVRKLFELIKREEESGNYINAHDKQTEINILREFIQDLKELLDE